MEQKIHPRTIVISDVHIGAGELDNCIPKLEGLLIDFLNSLSSNKESVELVINGDFFDFVAADPWDDSNLEGRTSDGISLCFTEHQSLRKLKNIIKCHHWIFDALGNLLSALDDNRIVFLPGNHDADLFWPKVRQHLVQRICQNGQPAERVTFILERHYTIERGDTRYWIEHGHQHDPQNRFFADGKECWSTDAPPIFKDLNGVERLYECPGTLGLIRYINRWKQKYPSISYIKPYSKFLWALITYRGFREPGRPLLAVWNLIQLLGWDVDLRMSLGPKDYLYNACHDALIDLVNVLDQAEKEKFIEYLSKNGLDLTASLETYVASNFNREMLFGCVASTYFEKNIPAADRPNHATLGIVRNALTDIETRALEQSAGNLIDTKHADYVLNGHTHDAICNLDGKLLNSGCWVPNVEVTSSRQAKEAIFLHGKLPYHLTYLEISSQSHAPCLKTYLTGYVEL